MKDANAPLCDRVTPESAPQRSQKSPPLNILVVDDDVSIRDMHSQMLSRCGYAVVATEDGAAGWDALNADSYDLLITDNFMPKVTGIELLVKIRAARMNVPVIMATRSEPTKEFARRPWLQPDAVLLKPYTFEQLLGTVRKVLREQNITTDRSASTDAPVSKSAPVAEASGAARPAHRILVVDEDRDLRQFYSEALTRPDCEVHTAEDGALGWEALQANSYNLLITEHELPKLTGVELVRKLRAAHMALPVIMATGTLPAHELALYPSLQLAATLLKPFEIDALQTTVKNVLHAADGPRELIDPLPNRQRQSSTGDFQL